VFPGSRARRRDLIRRATTAESDAASTRAELHAAYASIRALREYSQRLQAENRTLRCAYGDLDQAIKALRASRDRLDGVRP
jgi:hypothetical protein